MAYAAPGSRLLPIAGARNLRDIGGYTTADGRLVRRGMVLRSGHPAGISPEAYPDVRAVGLAAIVDMRTTAEREQHPYPTELMADVVCWARDYDLSGGDLIRLLRAPSRTAEGVERVMLETYRQMPIEQAEAIGAMMRLLIGKHVPLLVNCTAGKDRTGVAIAILLSALGVPRVTVIADYVLTEQLYDPAGPLSNIDPNGPLAFLLELDPEIWRVTMRSAPHYIEAMLDELNTRFGSVVNYLKQVATVDEEQLSSLRALLLEPGGAR